jgi:signal peptidase
LPAAGLLKACGRAACWGLVGVSSTLLLALGIGPRTGLYRTLTVLSGSMTPGIPVGAVVIDSPERPQDLRVGQVITYQIPVDDHRVVSHRVVKILAGGPTPVVQTKGDANASPDPWMAQLGGSVVWRVRATIPKLGLAIVALRTPAARRVFLLVIPVLLAAVWLGDIWRWPERLTAGRRHAPAGA